jgi:TRAP-type C4-dicarboxylate transport system substrate-binding protein
VFAMNKAKYDALPADIKKVIDANSGLATSKWVGKVMDEGDAPGIEAAKAAGNKLITLDATETARWKAAAAPIAEAWVKEMAGKGYPATDMLTDAKALIVKYAGAE